MKFTVDKIAKLLGNIEKKEFKYEKCNVKSDIVETYMFHRK